MSRPEALKLETDTVVRKTRRIPAKGDVLVKRGDLVEAETIVAKGAVTNPEIVEVRVSSQLDVDPQDAKKYLLKGEGDHVNREEVIAIHRSFFGRLTKVSRSPISGTIEAFSESSGRALVRGEPIPVEVKAHIPGRVVETVPGEGAVIESRVALIEGVFGVGGEAVGELVVAVDQPSEALTSEEVNEEHKRKILVGGSFVTLDALRRAAGIGVAGIICGGVDEKDLTDFLGHEIGIGVTGTEKTGLTLIVTEGFGVHPMEERTFRLLKSNDGKRASIDGSTQIRSRMLRPEIIIPL